MLKCLNACGTIISLQKAFKITHMLFMSKKKDKKRKYTERNLQNNWTTLRREHGVQDGTYEYENGKFS